jgi:hypothetical protein
MLVQKVAFLKTFCPDLPENGQKSPFFAQNRQKSGNFGTPTPPGYLGGVRPHFSTPKFVEKRHHLGRDT